MEESFAMKNGLVNFMLFLTLKIILWRNYLIFENSKYILCFQFKL